MNVRSLYDRLVRRRERKQTTGKNVAPDVKPEDKIPFGRYAGTELIDGDEVLIVREDEVRAVQTK